MNGERLCPEDLLENPVMDDLNYWLARFVAEVRNHEGGRYTPRSIHQILCGVQRYMLDKNPTAPKILGKDDPRFVTFRSAVDNVFRQLHSEGIGTEVRRAPIITADEEEKLWLSSILTITTPKGLQRAVFYYIGKCFCVRGGQEQRNLGPSHFRFLTNPGCDPHCVIYEEHGSKNHPGGLKDLRVDNKTVPCHAMPEQSPKRLVFLLNLYIKRLPKYAFVHDVLYLRPKPKCPADPDAPWYEEKPVGKNTHSTMMKGMSVECGIATKTNHSLRATGVTSMFQANVPEKIIQKTTGHRSVEALRSYERISANQYKSVSKVLMSNAMYEKSDLGETNSQKENSPSVIHTKPADGTCLSHVLGDMTNCTIGSLSINIKPVITMQKTETEIEQALVSAAETPL